MRLTPLTGGFIAVVIAAVFFFVGFSWDSLWGGPKRDHNPIGYNAAPQAQLSGPSPSPSASESPNPLHVTATPNVSIAASACTGSNCTVQIHILRSDPAACDAGDADALCASMTCPTGAACISFEGNSSVSHIDHNRNKHTPETMALQGIIVLSKP
jgi:hypothetical protein